MPVLLLPDKIDDPLSPTSFFYELYKKLWRREHCDEDTVRREIYKGEKGDDERTSGTGPDPMDTDDTVIFRPQFLDLSSVPNALTLRFTSTVLVRQEYKEAMRNLEMDTNNVVLSGQSGIGAYLRLS